MEIVEQLTELEQLITDIETPPQILSADCPTCQTFALGAKLCSYHLEKKEKIRELQRKWEQENRELLNEKKRKTRELKEKGLEEPQIKQELFEAGLLKREPKLDVPNEKFQDILPQNYEFGANLEENGSDKIEPNKNNLELEIERLKKELVFKDEKIKKLETENEILADERHAYRIKYETLRRSVDGFDPSLLWNAKADLTGTLLVEKHQLETTNRDCLLENERLKKKIEELNVR
jgi:hypothetical protein